MSLKRHDLDWTSGVFIAALGFAAFATWEFVRTEVLWKWLIWQAFIFAIAIAIVGARAFAGDAIVGFAVAFTLGFAVAYAERSVVHGASAGAITVSVGAAVAAAFAFVVPHPNYIGNTVISVISSVIFFAGVFASVLGGTVAWLSNAAKRNRWEGVFLSVFLAVMILSCLGAARLLSSEPSWKIAGPSLLFFGLLTLLNAPFDWASLGLTRALLRRGLELAGWWPFVLALADAALAAVIVALLALAMVVGVQAFDGLAVHGGGKPVLPLDQLFDDIEAHPEAPEFWWVYALLLSTMIPSLINLMIGGASLIRGVPGVPAQLLRYMPIGKAVAPFDRQWIALVVTVQVFVGAALGVAAQAFLAIGVIYHIMPWFGLGLLDMARGVAKFDANAVVFLVKLVN